MKASALLYRVRVAEDGPIHFKSSLHDLVACGAGNPTDRGPRSLRDDVDCPNCLRLLPADERKS